MNTEDKKIAIIGCGNLGLSILNGLTSSPSYINENLTATRRNTSSIQGFSKDGVKITSDNYEAVKNSNIVIVALKPYKILEVLEELKPILNSKKHTIVSLATGISINQIEKILGEEMPIYRAMPNTGSDVKESLTCICSNQSERTSNVESIFSAIGKTIQINESLMEAATVLGACGIEIGFDAQTATEIVTQTVKGASELLIQNKQHPEFEIDKVTTPRGCTIAGLNEMEHNGFSSALIKGIVTSFEKID